MLDADWSIQCSNTLILSLSESSRLIQWVEWTESLNDLVFLKEINTFIFIKDALNRSKVTVNAFIILQNIYISNKCCSIELSIHLWILNNKIHHGFHKNINVFNIDNNQKCFLSSKSEYYYDFWRSCDTEDWSNDAENTALITEINYSLIDIHIENSCFKSQ